MSNWPLADIPQAGARIVIASQGMRIWTAECLLEAFGEDLRLSCSDKTTIENLGRQKRVAFSIIGQDASLNIQGSAMASVIEGTDSKENIRLEPYRVGVGTETYELKLNGWSPAKVTGATDVSAYSFWYQAFRLVTLPLSVIPVLAGGMAAFAQGRLNIGLLVLAFIGAVLAHAGANAMADYFDFKKGVDLSKALSSHLGALAQEKVEPEMILFAAIACLTVTVLIGLILMQLVGWMLLLFGLAGILGAFFYTGRPFSYKYRGMGELMLGIMMGPVIVMGSYYVQTRQWDWIVFLISMALAVVVSSASLANNLRDLVDDEAAGIHTLPMTLGVSRTKKLYYALIWGPYVFTAAVIGLHPAYWPVALVLVSLPLAIKATGALRNTQNDIQDIRQKSIKTPFPLNSIKLHARFGSLLIVGLVIAGLVRIFV